MAVVCIVRSGLARVPSSDADGSRQRGSGSTCGYTMTVDGRADRRVRLEEPERVAGADDHRLDPEVAAARERHARDPRALACACRAASARPGSGTGSDVGLCTSSQGLGRRLVLRTV